MVSIFGCYACFGFGFGRCCCGVVVDVPSPGRFAFGPLGLGCDPGRQLVSRTNARLPSSARCTRLVGNNSAAGSEATSAMMQRFWDSAMSVGPLDDDYDSRCEGSTKVASETTYIGRSAFYPSSGLSNTFGFKIQDKQGRMHRFNCETSSLTDLITCILQRDGDDIDRKNLLQILYEDEDDDKVILSSDSDLVAAVDHARQIGWKVMSFSGKDDFCSPCQGVLIYASAAEFKVAPRLCCCWSPEEGVVPWICSIAPKLE